MLSTTSLGRTQVLAETRPKIVSGRVSQAKRSGRAGSQHRSHQLFGFHPSFFFGTAGSSAWSQSAPTTRSASDPFGNGRSIGTSVANPVSGSPGSSLPDGPRHPSRLARQAGGIGGVVDLLPTSTFVTSRIVRSMPA